MIALLVALAVIAGLEALRPRTATTSALVASRDLAALVPLAAGDVAVREVPRDAVPATALVDAHSAVGRRLVGPIAAGEIITTSRIAMNVVPEGRVAVPVRFADDAVADVLSPGDVIDVISDNRTVARAAVVLRILRSSGATTSTVVVIHVTDTVATAVASAASAGQLWATLPGGD